MIAAAVAGLLGFLLWRCMPAEAGSPGPVTGPVLWAIVGTGGWMSLLSLAGLPWKTWGLLLPLAVVAVVALRRGRAVRPVPTLDAWAILAAAATGLRALAVALTPAYGWDFRYLWGLKAEAFAAARGIDVAWLAWRPLADLHPSYPPLWPELIAAGPLLGGGSTAHAAAAWSALLVVGLAAVGWDAAHRCTRPVRAATAVALAWAPVLFRPDYSGYAEPLVAFLLAVALVALADVPRNAPGALLTLAVAAAALVVAKNEGLVLGLACVTAAAILRGRRALPAATLTAAAVALWRVVVAVNDLPHPGAVHDSATLLDRLQAAPAALAAALTATTALVLTTWALLAPTLLARQTRAPAIVLLVWGAAAAAAYLTTPWGFAWHLAWSLDRVAAVALPAALAVALPAAFSPAAGPPARGTSPGG